MAIGSALAPNMNLHYHSEHHSPYAGDSMRLPHPTPILLKAPSVAEAYRQLAGSGKVQDSLEFCWVVQGLVLVTSGFNSQSDC